MVIPAKFSVTSPVGFLRVTSARFLVTSLVRIFKVTSARFSEDFPFFASSSSGFVVSVTVNLWFLDIMDALSTGFLINFSTFASSSFDFVIG